MSGFVALVERGGTPVDPALLDRLTATLAFRGPDGSASHIVGPAGLSAALFRTTNDTRPETQPLSLDGECWIVGQVRLDARTDLRAELARAGERAAPDTPDLELLLRAWRVWGADCLPRLYGDFSFAIWDGRSGTLSAGRDAAGVRQLFWAEADGSLLVGNTLKCLLSHPGISNRLDPAAVGSWLAFGQLDTAAATFFPAVRRVSPAHLLTWRRESGVEVSRYWSLPVDGRLRISRPEEEIESFRTLFTAAVSDRIRTGGLGAHLSGGLDSSSIAVTAQRLIRDSPNPGKLRCYTGEYRHRILDEEGEYAALIARHAGLDQLRVPLDDLLTHPPIAPPHFLSPEPGTIPELSPESSMLADLVRFGRVMLSGSGGDPLFTRPQRPLVTLIRRGGWSATVNAMRNCLAIGARPALAIRASLGIQSGMPRKPSDLPAFIRMEPEAWQRLITINQRNWRDRATAELSRLMVESAN
ncbi:MAG: asparagine synthetase B, partial [Gemmatimonadota bacterium]